MNGGVWGHFGDGWGHFGVGLGGILSWGLGAFYRVVWGHFSGHFGMDFGAFCWFLVCCLFVACLLLVYYATIKSFNVHFP